MKYASLAMFGSAAAVAACSGGMPESSLESVGVTQSAFLAAACDTTGGNLILTLQDGESAYVGRQSGCAVEPCVVTNAKDGSGNVCRLNTTGRTITVSVGTPNATHTEKATFDFRRRLSAIAAIHTPL